VRCKCIYKGVKSREVCEKNYGSQWFVNGLKKDSMDVVFGIFRGGLKKGSMSMWGEIFTCLGGD